MIDQIFQVSAAAAAAFANFAPTNFNPIPADGTIEAWAVTDQVAGLTALPTLQIILGGQAPMIPVPGSVIPVNRAAAAFGPGPDLLNRVMPRLPVRQGLNLQVNVAGGVGATSISRIRLSFMTADEAAQHPVALG